MQYVHGLLLGWLAIGFSGTVSVTGIAMPGTSQSSTSISDARCEAVGMVAVPMSDGDTVWFDRSPVTVGQFGRYVQANHLVTQAECFGNSSVFDYASQRWLLAEGAFWRRPFGKTGAAARYDHPVTHINFFEAEAYCKSMGKRLPWASEWEAAARYRQPGYSSPYPWGGDIQDEKGKFRANVWQGIFPFEQKHEDGYPYTSPVGAFGEHPSGLTDMAGNVWEWVQDSLAGVALPGEQTHRLGKGGSFLCEPLWCHGYLINGSTHTSPESGLFHTGFRCVCGPYVR